MISFRCFCVSVLAEDVARVRLLFIALALAITAIRTCKAGPLLNNGVALNTTSGGKSKAVIGAEAEAVAAVGVGGCAVGDLVYAFGDEFPGASPCEMCICGTDSRVKCTQRRCPQRPGCKALHRPDHCCPTYQCECEKEGRVYGNGEKLVDPKEPCRVCYCQGGEVVCRRIACFLRDDCRPKLVPGRCCPEYDHCPLRDAGTDLHKLSVETTTLSNIGSKKIDESVAKEQSHNINKEITIKEITKVSEIPVTDNIKIKEVLPSAIIEAVEFLASKRPPISREVNTLTHFNDSGHTVTETYNSQVNAITGTPSISTASADLNNIDLIDNTNKKVDNVTLQQQSGESTLKNVFIKINPTNSGYSEITSIKNKSKGSSGDDDDTTQVDHDPAFPPIPDDLSVLSNRDEDFTPEAITDNGRVSLERSPIVVIYDTLSTSTLIPPNTEKVISTKALPKDETAREIYESVTTMLNIKSELPAEILDLPSSVAEVITGELDEIESNTEFIENTDSVTSSPVPYEENIENNNDGSAGTEDSTMHVINSLELQNKFNTRNMETDSSKYSAYDSSVNTDINSQFNTVAIETSKSDRVQGAETTNENTNLPTETSSYFPTYSRTKTVAPEVMTTAINTAAEIIVDMPPKTNLKGESEKIEETRESSIAVAEEPRKESPKREGNGNVLTDLINLVGDVASISEHTEKPDTSTSMRYNSAHVDISASEELMPLNAAAGYKSKNSNRNSNSITEIPTKTTRQHTTKSVEAELELEETEEATEVTSFDDRTEPTTRRPIVDDVSDTDTTPKTRNKAVKKDIEIITKSYVPTLNKKPTKVISKKSTDRERGPSTAVPSEGIS